MKRENTKKGVYVTFFLIVWQFFLSGLARFVSWLYGARQIEISLWSIRTTFDCFLPNDMRMVSPGLGPREFEEFMFTPILYSLCFFFKNRAQKSIVRSLCISVLSIPVIIYELMKMAWLAVIWRFAIERYGIYSWDYT